MLVPRFAALARVAPRQQSCTSTRLMERARKLHRKAGALWSSVLFPPAFCLLSSTHLDSNRRLSALCDCRGTGLEFFVRSDVLHTQPAFKWPFQARDFTMATGSLQLDIEPSAMTLPQLARTYESSCSMQQRLARHSRKDRLRGPRVADPGRP